LNDFQFENLIKALELCFKQNYCALYFEDIVKKFCPEVPENALKSAVDVMIRRKKLVVDGTLLRLVVR
jgi:hypothetical protein